MIMVGGGVVRLLVRTDPYRPWRWHISAEPVPHNWANYLRAVRMIEAFAAFNQAVEAHPEYANSAYFFKERSGVHFELGAVGRVHQ